MFELSHIGWLATSSKVETVLVKFNSAQYWNISYHNPLVQWPRQVAISFCVHILCWYVFSREVQIWLDTLHPEAIQIARCTQDPFQFKAFVLDNDLYYFMTTWLIFLIHNCPFSFVLFIVPNKFVHIVFDPVYKLKLGVGTIHKIYIILV